MSTRSPGRSPRAPRAVAAPRTESASCLKDSEDSLVTIAGVCPNRFAAELSNSGTVAKLLAKDLLSDAKGRIRRRNPAIHGRLQQDFAQLVDGDAVSQRPPQVEGELFRPVEGDSHRHGDAATRPSVQPGPGPDLTPGVSREQILKIFAEASILCLRTIDILVPPYFAPNLPASDVALFVVHDSRA